MADEVATSAVPPVPSHVPPVSPLNKMGLFSVAWVQWFEQVKIKIDKLNTSIITLAGLNTQGILLSDGAGDWSTIPNGTDTDVLTMVAGAPTWAPPGSSYMTYVTGVEISGGAVTAFPSITGLDLDADGLYFIKFKIKNATASGFNILSYVNADTTAGNYDSNIGTFAAANAFTSGRAVSARLLDVPVSSYACGECYLEKDCQGKATFIYDGVDGITTSLRRVWSGVVWRTTGVNVTALLPTSSVANSIDNGSRIDIWKITQ